MTTISRTVPTRSLADLLVGKNGSRRRVPTKRKSPIPIWQCCRISVGTILVWFSALLAKEVIFPAPGWNFWTSGFWRRSHYPNADTNRLQQIFPQHVGGDLERIQHPGFLLSDSKRLSAILGETSFSKELLVPRFWNPSAYGSNGVRAFLGDNGKYLITPTEAAAIGSKYQGNDTIFVAVSSYRDPECLATVEDIFQRAKFPDRIRVAIVDQRRDDEGDPVCSRPARPCDDDSEQALCKYAHLVDAMEYDAQLMVGPTFARHLAYRMYRGEYFAMQVDSHVRFVANWDEDIIDQWTSTGNEMAVISTYLSDIVNSIDEVTHKSLREARSIMCRAEYEWKKDSREHIRFTVQPTNKPQIQTSPMLHPFWAAGFSFARGHFVVQVPYDQYLPMVFQGEEISMTVRGFTHGYDFYAPSRNVAYHMYSNKVGRSNQGGGKIFTENSVMFPGAKEEAYHRLNGIIGVGNHAVNFNRVEQDMYGLGNVRKLQQFYHTFGIDVKGSEMERGLCDFVQGIGIHKSMHAKFSPYIRYDAIGIDYSRINFAFVEQGHVDTPISARELATLQEHLRRRSSTPYSQQT